MIAIRGLAAAAVLGTAALAFNPLANAGPDRDSVTVAFTYDAAKAPLENYLAFTRQAERACAERAVRSLDQRVLRPGVRTRRHAAAAGQALRNHCRLLRD